MRPKRSFSISLSLSGWLILAAACLVAVAVVALTAVRAQGSDVPDINNSQAAGTAEQAPEAPPEVPPAPDCGGNLPTINGECISPDELGSAGGSLEGGGEVMAGAGPRRHSYITSANYETNHVLTACAAGYHMASLWEILDVSNLVYDYDHPAAKRQADSGFGPPSYWYGWVRTGYGSSDSGTTGTGNCHAWTSASSADHGVAIKLSNMWETAPGDILTWDATSFTCDYIGPVWCVVDIGAVYLPLVMRRH